jgi:hypothetical protein
MIESYDFDHFIALYAIICTLYSSRTGVLYTLAF